MTPRDPYNDAKPPLDAVNPGADQAPTQPRRFDQGEGSRSGWLPMLLVMALLVGASLYYLANTSDTNAIFGSQDTSNQNSEGSSVSKSAPSPN